MACVLKTIIPDTNAVAAGFQASSETGLSQVDRTYTDIHLITVVRTEMNRNSRRRYSANVAKNLRKRLGRRQEVGDVEKNDTQDVHCITLQNQTEHFCTDEYELLKRRAASE